MSNAEEDDGNCALWCSVIEQALDDALSDKRLAAEDRQEARAWFERDGEDFREVCALAGLEPDRVRTEALKRIADHDAGTTKKKITPRTKVQHDGKLLELREWARITGIKVNTLLYRISLGWSNEAVITTPLKRELKPKPDVHHLRRLNPRRVHHGNFGMPSKMLTHNGETLSVSQWATRIGISRAGLHMRLSRGMSVADALTTPADPRLAKRQSALTAPA